MSALHATGRCQLDPHGNGCGCEEKVITHGTGRSCGGKRSRRLANRAVSCLACITPCFFVSLCASLGFVRAHFPRKARFYVSPKYHSKNGDA